MSDSWNALERLRAQIIYATRGKSRPTEFSLPPNEYEELLADISALPGIQGLPMVDLNDTREHVLVYDVRVLKGE